MVNNKPILDKFDLSSVTTIYSGAAPLGAETAQDLQKQYPKWLIRQGYGKQFIRPSINFISTFMFIFIIGLTETSPVVCSTGANDIWFGSSGSLLPMIEAKIISTEGVEITGYDKPGELVVKSPSVVLGYLNNPKANSETFRNGWLFTGDEAVVRVGPKGYEHIFITDRIKELIKVKVSCCCRSILVWKFR